MWLPCAVKFPLGAWHDIKFSQRHYIKKRVPSHSNDFLYKTGPLTWTIEWWLQRKWWRMFFVHLENTPYIKDQKPAKPHFRYSVLPFLGTEELLMSRKTTKYRSNKEKAGRSKAQCLEGQGPGFGRTRGTPPAAMSSPRCPPLFGADRNNGAQRKYLWRNDVSQMQFRSVAQLCPTLCDPMDCSTSGFPVHHQIPELAQTHVHPIGDVIQPSHPLSSLTFNHSRIRVFSNESVLHIRWPKYWSFSFSISPSTEYSGLTSFRMDCLDLLTVQGTLKSLLQRHSSKASILRHSAFLTVQLSHPYMTTGKAIALT